MTTGYYYLIAIIIGALGIIGCFWLAVHVAHKDGFNEGREYERNRRNQRALEAARTPSRLLQQPAPYVGQHAPWTPRYTVTRSATIAFAGGPATIPINARSSDSGELRALVARSDRFIEDMRRQGAAHRRQLVIR